MAEQVTVLLVEDEPSFVEALVVGLKREGFRVEVAMTGLRPWRSSRPYGPIWSCSTSCCRRFRASTCAGRFGPAVRAPR